MSLASQLAGERAWADALAAARRLLRGRGPSTCTKCGFVLHDHADDCSLLIARARLVLEERADRRRRLDKDMNRFWH